MGYLNMGPAALSSASFRKLSYMPRLVLHHRADQSLLVGNLMDTHWLSAAQTFVFTPLAPWTHLACQLVPY